MRDKISDLLLVVVVVWPAGVALGLNLPPYFTADMNQHTLVENTRK